MPEDPEQDRECQRYQQAAGGLDLAYQGRLPEAEDLCLLGESHNQDGCRVGRLSATPSE